MLGLTEPAGMRCPKRTWYFLWIFAVVPYHDLEFYRVKPWAFGKYEVFAECSVCGARDSRFGVTEGELVSCGFDPKQLRENDGWKKGDSR